MYLLPPIDVSISPNLLQNILCLSNSLGLLTSLWAQKKSQPSLSHSTPYSPFFSFSLELPPSSDTPITVLSECFYIVSLNLIFIGELIVHLALSHRKIYSTCHFGTVSLFRKKYPVFLNFGMQICFAMRQQFYN